MGRAGERAEAERQAPVARNLPAIKGSRQGIAVMLASAILRNKKTHLQYMHEICADQRGHNDLVKKVHDGLQDK